MEAKSVVTKKNKHLALNALLSHPDDKLGLRRCWTSGMFHSAIHYGKRASGQSEGDGFEMNSKKATPKRKSIFFDSNLGVAESLYAEMSSLANNPEQFSRFLCTLVNRGEVEFHFLTLGFLPKESSRMI